jgi:hypothetical protein
MLIWPRVVWGSTLCRLAHLVYLFNVKWRCYVWAGGVEESKFCLFSVVFPVRCISSVSPGFYFRKHAFCFLPLGAWEVFPFLSFFPYYNYFVFKPWNYLPLVLVSGVAFNWIFCFLLKGPLISRASVFFFVVFGGLAIFLLNSVLFLLPYSFSCLFVSSFYDSAVCILSELI